MFALVGLAREGRPPGRSPPLGRTELAARRQLYERGTTWGQFNANLLLQSPRDIPELRIFGDRGLVQTTRLRLAAYERRVIG